MKCEVCNEEKENLKMIKWKGRFLKIVCECCEGAHEDYCERKMDERREE